MSLATVEVMGFHLPEHVVQGALHEWASDNPAGLRRLKTGYLHATEAKIAAMTGIVMASLANIMDHEPEFKMYVSDANHVLNGLDGAAQQVFRGVFDRCIDQARVHCAQEREEAIKQRMDVVYASLCDNPH